MSNEFDLTLYRRRGQVVVWGKNYYNCLKISSCIVVDVVQSLSLSSSLQPHGLQLGRLLSQCLLKLKSTESVMLSNHLILCWPLSFHLQSFPPSESFLKQSTLCIGCFLETDIKTSGDLLRLSLLLKSLIKIAHI